MSLTTTRPSSSQSTRGAERGVVDDPAAVERAEEVLDLVDRDGVADADVHPAALLERAAAVDADQPALGVEQRAAGVARVDRGVGLQAVGVFQQRAGRVLVAVDAGDDPVGHGGLEVGGQQEGVAHGEDPVADADLVAVAQLGVGKSSRPKSLIRATSPVGSMPTSTAS